MNGLLNILQMLTRILTRYERRQRDRAARARLRHFMETDETEAENFIAERDDETPEHLTPVVTDRGFAHLPPIPHFFADRDSGEVRAYESSNAETPAIWLNVEDETAQLTVENARKLGEQLIWLADNHYQG